jgi:hypothetical protein
MLSVRACDASVLHQQSNHPATRTTHPRTPCLLPACLCRAPGEKGDYYSEHIAPLRASAPASMRCVLVSATLPQHTFDELQELFVGLSAAFGPGLHRTATGGRTGVRAGVGGRWHAIAVGCAWVDVTDMTPAPCTADHPRVG